MPFLSCASHKEIPSAKYQITNKLQNWKFQNSKQFGISVAGICNLLGICQPVAGPLWRRVCNLGFSRAEREMGRSESFHGDCLPKTQLPANS